MKATLLVMAGLSRFIKETLELLGRLTMVAFKRLDRNHGQGDPGIVIEITMLSQYVHENLISLLGFCKERDETILVYESMAKQKIVVRVAINSNKKSRKALAVAANLKGVESAFFVGSDQIAVTGEGIDPVKLATLLRKRVGYTELVSVGNVKDKNPETKPAEVTWQTNPYEYYYNSYAIIN
ncbi:heavy metal-associated isoprenylated plant protein 47-like protein [Tanacetum coccineum]